MTSASDRIMRAAPYGMLALVLLWVAEHAWQPLHDPDTWWHLRLGEDFLHQRSLAPPTDWSSYATAAWVPTEPLPEVFEALVYRVGGLPGVAWTYVVSVVLLVLVLFFVCRRYAGPLPAVVATLLFVAAGQGSLTPRPQLISYFLLLASVETWRQTQNDLRPRWWLVPMTWLWSLCHGFWFLGVGYGAMAAFSLALERRARPAQIAHSLAVALASFVVVLLNPNGLAVLEGPFQVSNSMHYVTEWARPSMESGPALTATVMAVAVGALWVARHQRIVWFDVLVLMSALSFDWYALRTTVLGALVAAPLLAASLQSVVGETEGTRGASMGRPERQAVALGGLTLAILAAVVVPHTASRPGGVPTALNTRLDALPAGTGVFNDYLLGGWIAWRHPDLNQYIDGLITPYTVHHVEDFHRTQVLAHGWYGVVRDSHAAVALLAQESALASGLEARGWKPIGSDARFVLLNSPSHQY